MKVIKPHDYKQHQIIFFNNDKLPYTIQVISDNFAICTRPIDKKEDKDELSKPFESYSKDTVIYTIIDFNKSWRGPDNHVFSPYDYKTLKDCTKALKSLEKQDMEVSTRNGIDLDINTYKTIVHLHKAFGIAKEDR